MARRKKSDTVYVLIWQTPKDGRNIGAVYSTKAAGTASLERHVKTALHGPSGYLAVSTERYVGCLKSTVGMIFHLETWSVQD